MTCRELLRRFKEALEKDKLDLEAFQALMYKCDQSFGEEALRIAARKVMHYAMTYAWAYFKGAVITGRDPAAAYGRAVQIIWEPADWYEMPCEVLAEYAAYTAEAAARHKWPAKWPFLVPAAVAAEVNACELPDSVAEVLGADEYAKLESFLEQGEAVVEVAPGLRVALIRDGRYVVMVA
jgi:hypothetical protein